MKSFELIKTSGPHGDECCSYDIKFNKEMTLKEFLQELHPKEWGYVNVRVPDPSTWNLEYAAEHEKYRIINIEYSHDEIVDMSYDVLQYMNTNIDIEHCTAYGGWSRMDYNIYLKV